jgi:argininosuccinate lyase
MKPSKPPKSGKGAKAALWSGRFAAAPDALVQEFTRSVHFDKRLFRHDIQGSLAHAKMLAKQGLLTAGEHAAIEKGLKAVGRQIEAGAFTWRDDLEDVHMNIESALTASVPAGAKLHTGRSRNDQVATDMRLWLKDQIAGDLASVHRLQRALVALAESHQDVLLPGYTHLQRGQPVTLAHHLLAYVEMLGRDADRLVDALVRADVLPLGSGALAGSTLPLDREFVRKQLGFAELSRNSLDAVSDRDFIAEYCFAAALSAVHLSRLGEDLVLWSSAEFAFVRLGDAFTTGSSLMPQKKNPDVAELVRGKAGRMLGNLVSILTLLKGLPMTYNRDLQEDKERLFDSADTFRISLDVLAAMLADVQVDKTRCFAAAADPALLATDVADALVKIGIPFRHAHEIVGKAVAKAEAQSIPLDELPLSQWKEIDGRITEACVRVFDPRAALDRRNMAGSPKPAEVAKQLRFWRKKLGAGRIDP